MRVTSVINYKGGVGKTSVTANLSAELARRGCKVLLLDMDPQASLTFSFIRPEDWERNYATGKTIKEWFDSMNKPAQIPISSLIITPPKVQSYIQPVKNGGRLDLVASHLGLINVDLELATELGGASLKQTKENYLKVHRRLAEGIKELGDLNYDLILIDCPPNFNICTKNAIVASDSILIPAKPDYLSTLGIDYLRNSVNDLISQYNEFAALRDGTKTTPINPQILGVLFTMLDIRDGKPISALAPYIERTRRLGLSIFEQQLRENKTIYADAPEDGIPVVLRSTSNSSHKTVIQELQSATVEFAKIMELKLK